MSKNTSRRNRSRSSSVGRLTRSMAKVRIVEPVRRRGRSKSRSRARSRSRSRGGGGGGESGAQSSRSAFRATELFRLAKDELIYEVTGGKGVAIPLHPSYTTNGATPLAAPMLRSLAKNFARMQWKYLEIAYFPEVGTTSNGAVSFCVDWDTSIAATIDHTTISGRRPTYMGAVWQRTSMRISMPRQIRERWYITTNASKEAGELYPLNIMVYCSAPADTKCGYIRLRYSVEFMGPVPN